LILKHSKIANFPFEPEVRELDCVSHAWTV
jgi:hypothetical protein